MNKDPNITFQKLKSNPQLTMWWIYSRLTAKKRTTPDFIIAGTPRGGTTSLFQYLSLHPNIFPPLRKEVKYFDSFYFLGKIWYQAHFPYKRKIRENKGITGEATPNYLMHPVAMKRIASEIPDIKIILLLRNPIDRAYSHYKLTVKSGEEPLSFEEALAAEPDRLRGESEKIAKDLYYSQGNWIKYSYLSRGHYIEQVPQVFELFNKSQILILRSEDFYSNTNEIYQQVLQFLGVKTWRPEKFQIFKPSTTKSRMSKETRKMLVDHFEPYNHRLYEYLNRDFEWDS